MRTPIVAVLLLAGASAHAQDRGVWFAGGTLSNDESAYAGVVVALPGAALGRGLAARVSGSAGRYSYRTGGRTIDGEFAGGEIALVQQFSGAWGYANLGAGPRYTDTRLDPDDPDNDRRGGDWDAGVTTDGGLGARRWRLGWFGSYGILLEEYQARLDVTHALGERFRLGLEAGIQGDPTYTRGLFGAVGIARLGGGFELRVAGGATEQEGRSARAYGSVGLAQVF